MALQLLLQCQSLVPTLTGFTRCKQFFGFVRARRAASSILPALHLADHRATSSTVTCNAKFAPVIGVNHAGGPPPPFTFDVKDTMPLPVPLPVYVHTRSADSDGGVKPKRCRRSRTGMTYCTERPGCTFHSSQPKFTVTQTVQYSDPYNQYHMVHVPWTFFYKSVSKSKITSNLGI